MKLTESKLKEMIKEMMTTGRLIHNGKPALSENGKKIEEMLMSRQDGLINQAESLLDGISSVLDPLEADYLDALAKAASATATMKRMGSVAHPRNRSLDTDTRREYVRTYKAAGDGFRDAYDRLRRIVGETEAQRIHRNLQGVVA